MIRVIFDSPIASYELFTYWQLLLRKSVPENKSAHDVAFSVTFYLCWLYDIELSVCEPVVKLSLQVVEEHMVTKNKSYLTCLIARLNIQQIMGLTIKQDYSPTVATLIEIH